jgi:hypothetical protein
MGMFDLKDLTVNSGLFGTALVTLSAGIGQGPNIPCRTMQMIPDAGNTATVYLDANNAVSANSYPLPNIDLPLGIRNLNQLWFYSTQANAKIHLLWRL